MFFVSFKQQLKTQVIFNFQLLILYSGNISS